MPNWCDNRLVVIGEDSVLDEFTAAIRFEDGNYSIMDRLIPFPPGLAGEEIVLNNGEKMSTFSDRGYNWCLENWGCKWSDKDTLLISNDAGEMTFYLTTPWGPPDKGMISVSKMFPSLTFLLMYHEDGMRFAGGMAVKNGKIITEYDDSDIVPTYDFENNDEAKWVEELEEMYSLIRRRLDYTLDHSFVL
jgi:hypothetical protein